jgi:hypothetical protein
MDAAATLDLFVAGTFNASNGLTLGSTSDPAHCRAYVAGATFNVSGSATIGCNVYAPEAQVILANGSTAFGSIFGKSIQANGNATVHYDTSIASAGRRVLLGRNVRRRKRLHHRRVQRRRHVQSRCGGERRDLHGTNKCDQLYSCQAGACVGSSPVTCVASDACHVAGTCDPASGACSNPDAPNGTSCNDGNACTQSDTCQSGDCTGSDPITCAAEDTCHVAGTCNPATGACSNPAAANGTTCSDGGTHAGRIARCRSRRPSLVLTARRFGYTPVDFLASYTPPVIDAGLPSTQYDFGCCNSNPAQDHGRARGEARDSAHVRAVEVGATAMSPGFRAPW